MKKNKFSAVIFAAVCVFCVIFTSCSSDPPDTAMPNVPYGDVTAAKGEALKIDTGEALKNGYRPFNVNIADNGFTFEYSSLDENYIITASRGPEGANVWFTVENKDFSALTIGFAAPEGFTLNTADRTSIKLLKSPTNDRSSPDIIEVIFSDTDDKKAALFYAVSDGQLRELTIYRYSTFGLEPMDYAEEITLIPTENFKFLVPAHIDYHGGRAVTTLECYTFDPNTLTMTLAPEKTTVDNPLYFGWAAYETANEIYSYFADKTLPIDETADYITITSTVDDEVYRYFKVSDPRFSNLTEMRVFVGNYFSVELTDKMFAVSPQKYRDINGQLYTLKSTATKNPEIESARITDYLIEDGNIVYRTVQDISVPENNITQPIDGGDFIVIPVGTSSFSVAGYNYPYK
ncbi:MAG: hypothetical protein LBM87_04230 [Ruminococcus sp.]|nr:hypothetical protein [Ruminococcus sp.]